MVAENPQQGRVWINVYLDVFSLTERLNRGIACGGLRSERCFNISRIPDLSKEKISNEGVTRPGSGGEGSNDWKITVKDQKKVNVGKTKISANDKAGSRSRQETSCI